MKTLCIAIMDNYGQVVTTANDVSLIFFIDAEQGSSYVPSLSSVK